MRQLGRTAAYGTVLDTLERFALDRGRALLLDNGTAGWRLRPTRRCRCSPSVSWENVGPLVELLALYDTPEWNGLWTAT